MFNESHYSDLEKDHKIKIFAYTSPSTSIKTTEYIKLEDVERMKTVNLPTGPLTSDGSYFGCNYYRNKEVDYLMEDEAFVNKANEQNITWFFPQDIQDIFVF